MASETYEFTESQNGLVRDLAQKMRTVGLVMVVLAVLALLAGIIGIFSGFVVRTGEREPAEVVGSSVNAVIQGALLLVTGLWTRKAGDSFGLIVTTQGNDIENLMGALGELRKLYRLQYFLILISLVFVALVLLLGLIGLVAGGAR